MEWMDLYDENHRLTGKTIVRGTPPAPGEYLMIVHACIFSPEGKLLIQKRQSTKKSWPGRWDLSAGGGVQAGEDSRTAVLREAREELGVELPLQTARPFLSVNYEHGFDEIYICTLEEKPELHLQAEEVCDARWADREEILRLMEQGEFVPYYESFLHLLFDMRTHMGFLVDAT